MIQFFSLTIWIAKTLRITWFGKNPKFSFFKTVKWTEISHKSMTCRTKGGTTTSTNWVKPQNLCASPPTISTNWLKEQDLRNRGRNKIVEESNSGRSGTADSGMNRTARLQEQQNSRQWEEQDSREERNSRMLVLYSWSLP